MFIIIKRGDKPIQAKNQRSKPGALNERRKPEKQIKNSLTSRLINMNNILKEVRSKKQEENTLKVLGIDPGSTKIGYGLLNVNGKELSVLGYGYLDITGFTNKGERLIQIQKDLKELFSKYKPDCIAIENIYFFKNAKTFNSVVESKGVILLTAAWAKIKVFEYTPLEIKQTITGYGKASKNLIQKLIQSSLSIKEDIKPDDASDALAVALCHVRNLTYC